MNKLHTTFAAGLLALTVAGTAFAAPKAPAAAGAKAPSKQHVMHVSSTKARPSQVTGIITAVSGNSLTLQPSRSKGAAQTIQIPTSAHILQGKKGLQLSALKAGERVRVSMNGSKAVTRVQVLSNARVVRPQAAKALKKS